MIQEYKTKEEWERIKKNDRTENLKMENNRNRNLKRRLLGFCGTKAIKSKKEISGIMENLGFDKQTKIIGYFEYNSGIGIRIVEVENRDGSVKKYKIEKYNHNNFEWDA